MKTEHARIDNRTSENKDGDLGVEQTDENTSRQAPLGASTEAGEARSSMDLKALTAR